jgi:hypothetical protein
MIKLQSYIIVALIIVFVVLFIISGEYSPKSPGFVSSVSGLQSTSCNDVNLSFVYAAQSSVKAPMGTDTLSRILINSTGNVTENISLSGSYVSQLSPQFGKSFLAQKGQQYFIEYGVYDPSLEGNYTLNLILTSSYGNCELSKPFSVVVEVTNTS